MLLHLYYTVSIPEYMNSEKSMEGQFRFHMGMGPALFMSVVLLSVSDTVYVSGSKVADIEQLGFRADLVHVDSLLSPFSPGNISYAERVQRAIYRSKKMVQKEVGASVIKGNGDYLMNLAIGTPALPYYAILDSGSDLIWTQCQPCVHCFKQTTPIYNPNRSSTYSKLPCKSALCNSDISFHCGDAGCEYEYDYADSSSTSGILSYETLTFTSKYGKKQSVPHMAFGCSTNSSGDFAPGAGIVGFGGGPVSLISQLAPSIPKRFSYCLLPIKDSQSKSSPLMFGKHAKLSSNAPSSTPLITNSLYPSLYYLALDGISVGTSLRIPNGTLNTQPVGNGPIIIDSGTTLTYLDPAAYSLLRRELVKLIKLPIGPPGALDLCFILPSSGALPNFPTITFHFRGADYPLTKANYMITGDKGLVCLAMLPNFEFNFFGNILQQNFHILYDQENERLSFEPAVCDSL